MIELVHAVFLGLLAGLTLWFGHSMGFFDWNSKRTWNSIVSLRLVLTAFTIYFLICFFFGQAFLFLLRTFSPQLDSIGMASWWNALTSCSVFIGLVTLLKCLPVATRRGIVHRDTASCNLIHDAKMGAFAWILSFPVVLFLTSFFEWVVLYVFKAGFIPDQLAVYFVKMTFVDPYYFALTIFTIVIITPLIEETLFRGFLQSFIRRHLGSKHAILITATCFAFFHFSPQQGLGNIPIVGTLFGLALFLGYLYEKQGSLFASISLHALFNGISILNLYFIGKISCFFNT